jgi:hypothetical protein
LASDEGFSGSLPVFPHPIPPHAARGGLGGWGWDKGCGRNIPFFCLPLLLSLIITGGHRNDAVRGCRGEQRGGCEEEEK